jgi:hypothetical protein
MVGLFGMENFGYLVGFFGLGHIEHILCYVYDIPIFGFFSFYFVLDIIFHIYCLFLRA